MDNHRQQIFTDGYTILPSLISSETCDLLKSYLDQNTPETPSFNYFEGHNQHYLAKERCSN